MTSETQPTIAKRHEQMFPVLEPHEIDRVRRFGELRSFNFGDALAEIGKIGAGFEGERLSGEVLDGGSDWQTVRPDGATTLKCAPRSEDDR
jgi:hypothetical protein